MVISLVGGIFLLGNIWMVVNWLEDAGAIRYARHIRKEHLTGTAITIIIVLLILLVKPGREAVSRSVLFRRCPVCDHRVIGRGEYCGECGSKV